MSYTYETAAVQFERQGKTFPENLEEFALSITKALEGAYTFALFGGAACYLLLENADRATKDVDVLVNVAKGSLVDVKDRLAANGFFVQPQPVENKVVVYKVTTKDEQVVKAEIRSPGDYELQESDVKPIKGIPVLKPTQFIVAQLESYHRRPKDRHLLDLQAVLRKYQGEVEWEYFSASDHVKAIAKFALEQGDIPESLWPANKRP